MLFLKLGSWLYLIAVHLAAPFYPKAKDAVQGRKGWKQRLENFVSKHQNQPIAWFHCASVGEFEQGRPVMEALKTKYPNYLIVLTYFSPSGYQARPKDGLADYIDYMPFDHSKNASQFLDILQPAKIFFIKYEFWPFYLDQIQERTIAFYLISGIFRPDQFLFKYKSALRLLKAFDHFFLQDEDSAHLLATHGFDNYTVTGDCRVDRVLNNKTSPFEDKAIATFCSTHPVIVAGSTWPKDQAQLIQLIKKHPTWRLLLVPHELSAMQLKHLKEQLAGTSFGFYTDPNVNWAERSIMVLDTMGMLSKVYRYATVTYVGGGFGKGIHNTLEAAVYGKPIIFGPKYHKFKEARDLIQLEAAFSYEKEIQLDEIFGQLMDEKKQMHIQKSLFKYFESNQGAAKKILDILNISL